VDGILGKVFLFVVCVVVVWMSLLRVDTPPFDGLGSATPLVGAALAYAGVWGAMFLVGYFVYRILYPAAPEYLWLQRDGVELDTRFQSPEVLPGAEIKGWWSGRLRVRIGCTIDLERLKSLRLRASFDGRRLTVDVDGRRIEIGRGVSEAEREWLAGVLADRYGLPQELVSGG